MKCSTPQRDDLPSEQHTKGAYQRNSPDRKRQAKPTRDGVLGSAQGVSEYDRPGQAGSVFAGSLDW